MLIFVVFFWPRKGTSLRRTTSFDVFCVKIGSGAWAVGRWKNPGKKKPSKHLWCAISRTRGKETHRGIVTKFCLLVDIRDIIRCATFGDDRLRGLGVVRGRISNFPIDLSRPPYNILALPSECVIIWILYVVCRTIVGAYRVARFRSKCKH